ncbi:hypothetical protein V2G26_011536 [Clonostachys chloroleuca]
MIHLVQHTEEYQTNTVVPLASWLSRPVRRIRQLLSRSLPHPSLIMGARRRPYTRQRARPGGPLQDLDLPRRCLQEALRLPLPKGVQVQFIRSGLQLSPRSTREGADLSQADQSQVVRFLVVQLSEVQFEVACLDLSLDRAFNHMSRPLR